jgi:ADP-heptose:LPS heptosyltransferase
MNQILILQLTRLGDIIQSLPLVADICASYPKSRITMLINGLFSEVSGIVPHIATIPIVLDEFVTLKDGEYTIIENHFFTQLIQRLNATDFDMVINLNNSVISRYITQRVRCHCKLGFFQDGISSIWGAYHTSFLRSRHLCSINLVDIFRRFLTFSDDSVVRESSAWHDVPTHRDKIIGMQCGARNAKRQFTLEQYTDIAIHHLEQGYQVYLFGMQSESQIAQQVVKSVGKKYVASIHGLINLTGQTDITQLVCRLKECERVYTPDTGTMHLAALCGTNITTVFSGPAYPHETLAYTKNVMVFMPDSSVFSCYPCRDDDKCPHGHRCRSFSFKNHLQGTANSDFLELQISADQIGILLRPLFQGAMLWREWCKYYFFGIPRTFEPTSKCIESIRRELALYKMIDMQDMERVTQNFDILLPMLYFHKLTNDKNIVDQMIEFFSQ